MSQILGFFSSTKLAATGQFSDDDLIDRLNHDYTSVVFVILAVVISTRQYVGDQIQCWVPGYFTSTYTDYTGKICWVTNTYYLPFDEDIDKAESSPHRRQISYYQWVHMVLVVQALFFYAPCVLWRALNGRSGIGLNNIIKSSLTLGDPQKSEKTMQYVMHQMSRYLGHYKDEERGTLARFRRWLAKRRWVPVAGKKYGNYLTTLYLCVKFIYLLNVIGQLFLMDVFLSTDYHAYGARVMYALARGEDWPNSERFPRVTLCDFNVRQLGNVHRYTVQCVLPINFFNEKIYLFLWFWLVIVMIITAFGGVSWFYRIVSLKHRVGFVRRHLQAIHALDEVDDGEELRRFVAEHLRHDGVMVLQMIGMNTDSIVVAEILAELWRRRPKPVNSGEHEPKSVDISPTTSETLPLHRGT